MNPLSSTSPPSGVIHPIDVVNAMNRTEIRRSVVFSDIGNCMAWLLRYLARDDPYTWHVNLGHGSMGHAIPAALGASHRLKKAVFAVTGDAALLMSAHELHTASEYDIPLKVIVFNDAGHGMVEKGVQAQWGDASGAYRFSYRVDAALCAESFGVRGYRATTLGELERALAAMLALPGPALVDVAIDPEAEPPIGSRTGMLAKSFAPKENA
jgi:acetolactate synthase I/II/III large subunit